MAGSTALNEETGYGQNPSPVSTTRATETMTTKSGPPRASAQASNCHLKGEAADTFVERANVVRDRGHHEAASDLVRGELP